MQDILDATGAAVKGVVNVISSVTHTSGADSSSPTSSPSTEERSRDIRMCATDLENSDGRLQELIVATKQFEVLLVKTQKEGFAKIAQMEKEYMTYLQTQFKTVTLQFDAAVKKQAAEAAKQRENLERVRAVVHASAATAAAISAPTCDDAAADEGLKNLRAALVESKSIDVIKSAEMLQSLPQIVTPSKPGEDWVKAIKDLGTIANVTRTITITNRRGVTVQQILDSVPQPCDLPAGNPDTHDGGACFDAVRRQVFSVHGNVNYGRDVFVLSLADNSCQHLPDLVPFSTHGQYPVWDHGNFVYVFECESGTFNRWGRINCTTFAFEELPSAKFSFCRFCQFVVDPTRRGLLVIDNAFFLRECNLDTLQWSDKIGKTSPFDGEGKGLSYSFGAASLLGCWGPGCFQVSAIYGKSELAGKMATVAVTKTGGSGKPAEYSVAINNLPGMESVGTYNITRCRVTTAIPGLRGQFIPIVQGIASDRKFYIWDPEQKADKKLWTPLSWTSTNDGAHTFWDEDTGRFYFQTNGQNTWNFVQLRV
ncbi:hypothetical protein Pelo_10929 [Pelomyxa schiedti]|nr:hypothetical protein Pelo_10929 [Pelomyxa schiedti]